MMGNSLQRLEGPMPLASAFREMRNEIGPPLSDSTGIIVQKVEHEVVGDGSFRISGRTWRM